MTTIQLGNLMPGDGFIIQGDDAYDRAGTSVAAAGDVNGDGIADLIVGAPLTGPLIQGAAYVVFGKIGDMRANIDLSFLTPADGFRILGEANNNYVGASVSSAGDLNGDGKADLIIGAPSASGGGNYSGQTYIVYGKSDGADIDLSMLTPADGYVIQGGAAGDRSGGSVSSAGDINNDSIPDFIIGARAHDSSAINAGAAYVIFGDGSNSRTFIDLAMLSPGDGFRITGEAGGDYAGYSVSSLGDINGDAIDDLVLSAPRNDLGGNDSGKTYVIFGKTGGMRSDIDLANLSASDGFAIQGKLNSQSGGSVSGAGDVNGDGIADLIIGAVFADTLGPLSGEAYVIFGKDTPRGAIDLANLAPDDGFVILSAAASDWLGVSVAAAGDVNGDGFDDVIVGAQYGGPGSYLSAAGAAYVIFGKSGGTRANVDLANPEADDVLVILGNQLGDEAGNRVSGAGDINFDGFDDLIIGARFGDNGGDSSGEAYVIFGSVDLGPNLAPTANDDMAMTSEDMPVDILVLANDSDRNAGDMLSVLSASDPDNGSATVMGGLSVTYNPDPDFFGTDIFTYIVSDGNGGTDEATVTVTVEPANDAPTAPMINAVLTDEDTPSAAVMIGAIDADFDAIAYRIKPGTEPAKGSVTFAGDNFTYTPAADENGADSFTILIEDGNGASAEQTVSVTINPVNDAPVAGDDTVSPIQIGQLDFTLFSALAGLTGRELWLTDGTANGSILLKDINPGIGDSDPTAFTALGDMVLFAADNGIDGSQLWISNGSAAGTQQLKIINPVGSSDPGQFFALGDNLLFTADDGVNGTELWVTDGTGGGTVLLKDINPGGGDSLPGGFTMLGGKALFSADNGSSGAELWITDGTAAGTVLLKDINAGSGGSGPAEFTVLDGKAFFSANDGVKGNELWVTDGTSAGTKLFKNVKSGPASSSPDGFFVFDDKLLFSADDGDGRELWISLGNSLTTFSLQGLYAGSGTTNPTQLTTLGDKILFYATDPIKGRELWVTDTTSEGTFLLTDLGPGTDEVTPSDLIVLGDKILFRAASAASGRELWVSDGTIAGTMLLKDINAGVGNSDPDGFSVLGDMVLFHAADAANGRELWGTDGTADGAVLIRNIGDGGNSSNPGDLTAIALTSSGSSVPTATIEASTLLANDSDVDGDMLTISAVSNPANGTVSLTGTAINFTPEAGFSGDAAFDYTVIDGNGGSATGHVIVPVSQTIVDPRFSAGDDVVTLGDGGESVNAGAGDDSVTGGAGPDTIFGGFGRDSLFGGLGDDELWGDQGNDFLDGGPGNNIAAFRGNLSDYLVAGYRLGSTVDFRPNTIFASVDYNQSDGRDEGRDQLQNFGFGASYHAIDGLNISVSATYGDFLSDSRDVMSVAPTPGRIRAVYGFGGDDDLSWSLQEAIDYGFAPLFLSGGDGNDTLSISGQYANHLVEGGTGNDIINAGFAAGVTYDGKVTARYSGSSSDYGVQFKAQINFLHTAGHENAATSISIYEVKDNNTSDGLNEGTDTLTNVDSLFFEGDGVTIDISGNANPIPSASNLTLFFATDANNGNELWITDGTASGTALLRDINAGPGNSDPAGFVQLGGQVLFSANDDNSGHELWSTDGTAAGTMLLADIASGSTGSGPDGFVVLGSKALFRAFDDVNGRELWVTDGSSAGTSLLKDINAGTAGSDLGDAIVLGGNAFFSAANGGQGAELWMSDGTAAGTVLLKDINSGSTGSSPENLTLLDGKLLFSADDGASGEELWVSDGTAGGTVVVKDINAGNGGSNPNQFQALGDKLVFSATDLTNGTELWVSDGTEAGTIMLADINEAGASSDPGNLIVLDDKLVFSATGTGSGRELWVTDGTVAGTMLLKDINPGSGNSDPGSLIRLGGTIVFRADDGTSGGELWVTDGTTAGTVQIKDISPGSGSSEPTNPIVLGDKLVFNANNGVSGREVWVTDGSEAGTLLLRDINAGPNWGNPFDFTLIGGKVLFNAFDPINGAEPWVTDGTAAGTWLLRDINAGMLSSFAGGFVTVQLNAAPVLQQTAQSFLGIPDAAVSFSVRASDADGDVLSYIVSAAPNGTVTGGTDGSFIYTPDPAFAGTDSFTVTVDDGKGGTAVQAVTVNVVAPPASNQFSLFVEGGFTGGIGGNGTVFGTAAFQHLSIIDVAGSVALDPSFNRGGDILELTGDAGSWSIIRVGSSALLSDGDTFVTVPVSPAGIAVQFGDGVRNLLFDSDSENFKIGDQVFVVGTMARIEAAADGTVLPIGADPAAKGVLFLAQGAAVSAAGVIDIFGTASAEPVQLISGNLTLDPSFNRGGDTISFDETAQDFSAVQSGTAVLLTGSDTTALVPVGTVGATLAFGDGSDARPILLDTSVPAIFIGAQTIGPDPVQLMAA